MSGDLHFSDSFVSDGVRGVSTEGVMNRTGAAGRGSIDLAISASAVGNSDTNGGAGDGVGAGAVFNINIIDHDSHHDEKDEALSLEFLKQHSKRASIKFKDVWAFWCW